MRFFEEPPEDNEPREKPARFTHMWALPERDLERESALEGMEDDPWHK